MNNCEINMGDDRWRMPFWKFILNIEGIVISICLGFIFESFSIVIFELIGIFVVNVFLKRIDDKSIKNLCIIEICGFIFILLVYFGNIAAFGKPYYLGGSDDYLFELTAREFISSNIKWPWDYEYASNLKGFYWILSIFMKIGDSLGGYNTVAFRVFNMNIHLAICCMIYRIFSYIEFEQNGKRKQKGAAAAMTVFGLFPHALYISAHVFRDTIVSFIILVCFSLINDIFRRNENNKNDYILFRSRTMSVIFLFILAFIGYWIRTEILYYIIIITAIDFAFRSEKSIIKKFLLLIFAALIICIIFNYLGLIEVFVNKIERYSDYRYRISEGGISQIIFGQPIIPFGWILRMAYGMITPLPIAIINITHLFDNGIIFLDFIIAIGVCGQIIAIPLLLTNNKLDKVFITFMLIYISIVFSTFTFRHLIMIYPFMSILIVRSYFHRDYNTRKKYILIGLAFLALLIIIYLIAKYWLKI